MKTANDTMKIYLEAREFIIKSVSSKTTIKEAGRLADKILVLLSEHEEKISRRCSICIINDCTSDHK